MSRVIRFEIHASRPQQLIDFYSELLGWRFSRMGPPDWWRIETGSAGEPGIDGGLVPRPCPPPGDTPAVNAFICTVLVASLDDTLSKGLSLGAVVALPKMPVPGKGWLAYIRDPDGNTLSLMQLDSRAG